MNYTLKENVIHYATCAALIAITLGCCGLLMFMGHGLMQRIFG